MLKPRVSAAEMMQHVKNSKLFDRVLSKVLVYFYKLYLYEGCNLTLWKTNILIAKVKVLSIENGTGHGEFTVEQEHINSQGELHPSFIITVGDNFSSYAFSTHKLGNNYHVSIDMQVA